MPASFEPEQRLGLAVLGKKQFSTSKSGTIHPRQHLAELSGGKHSLGLLPSSHTASQGDGGGLSGRGASLGAEAGRKPERLGARLEQLGSVVWLRTRERATVHLRGTVLKRKVELILYDAQIRGESRTPRHQMS